MIHLGPVRISVFGKTGSGKSELAALFWRTYPYDKLCVDPTHDAKVGPDVIELADPLPLRLPKPLREDQPYGAYRYKADAGSDTYVDDLDRAVGLAFYNDGPTLLWADEVGDLTRANATPPRFRRALHTGRHEALSQLLCGPRPKDIDPLVISQADLVICFALPNPADRKRVAEVIGWNPAEFDQAVHDLPKHGFLVYDSDADELVEYPPLPAYVISQNVTDSRPLTLTPAS